MKSKGLSTILVWGLSIVLTGLIPIGLRVQTWMADVPLAHYGTLALGKGLYYLGALPFLLVNALMMQFTKIDLYSLPLVGGMFIMVIVSFVLWWLVLVWKLGSVPQKALNKNVRFR